MRQVKIAGVKLLAERKKSTGLLDKRRYVGFGEVVLCCLHFWRWLTFLFMRIPALRLVVALVFILGMD